VAELILAERKVLHPEIQNFILPLRKTCHSSGKRLQPLTVIYEESHFYQHHTKYYTVFLWKVYCQGRDNHCRYWHV